jgi:Zn-dependent peptidase ImmA (M78 family)
MPANAITLRRQEEIVDIINNLKLQTGMTYPEYGIKTIIKASIENVLVKEDDFSGNVHIKGAVFRKSREYGQPVIAIQANQSPRSKTFALAHEFGHYLLKHNPDSNYLIDTREFDGSRGMQDEGEANFFAMSLLMPKGEFKKLDQPFVDDGQLAKYFGVTESQISVRREWLRKNGY